MKKLLVVLAFVSLGAWGCSTTPTDLPAEQMTLVQLTTIPGYAWFPAEMSAYTPDSVYVDIVSRNFTDPNKKICVFVKPSCACTGTKRLFPQLIKTMVEAKIDMNRVEIWSMRGATDKHPYQNQITLTDLPAIYFFNGTSISATIKDSEYNNNNADSLLAMAIVR
jgi:hypothetical protein